MNLGFADAVAAALLSRHAFGRHRFFDARSERHRCAPTPRPPTVGDAALLPVHARRSSAGVAASGPVPGPDFLEGPTVKVEA
jgi:hypothetical protein